jgi:hypothetical protein
MYLISLVESSNDRGHGPIVSDLSVSNRKIARPVFHFGTDSYRPHRLAANKISSNYRVFLGTYLE